MIHILRRIEEYAVPAQSEMQMRASRFPGTPHRGNPVSAIYLLFFRDGNILAMAIIGHITILVQQDNIIAVFRRVTRLIHDAICGCRDISACRGCKVYPFVYADLPGDRMYSLHIRISDTIIFAGIGISEQDELKDHIIPDAL